MIDAGYTLQSAEALSVLKTSRQSAAACACFCREGEGMNVEDPVVPEATPFDLFPHTRHLEATGSSRHTDGRKAEAWCFAAGEIRPRASTQDARIEQTQEYLAALFGPNR